MKRWTPGGVDAAVAVLPVIAEGCLAVVRDRGHLFTLSGDAYSVRSERGIRVEQLQHCPDVGADMSKLVDDIAAGHVRVILERVTRFARSLNRAIGSALRHRGTTPVRQRVLPLVVREPNRRPRAVCRDGEQLPARLAVRFVEQGDVQVAGPQRGVDDRLRLLIRFAGSGHRDVTGRTPRWWAWCQVGPRRPSPRPEPGSLRRGAGSVLCVSMSCNLVGIIRSLLSGGYSRARQQRVEVGAHGTNLLTDSDLLT